MEHWVTMNILCGVRENMTYTILLDAMTQGFPFRRPLVALFALSTLEKNGCSLCAAEADKSK
jgi:hypothetical protein